MNLNELRDKAYQCAIVHGWHEENLSDEHCLCLVISELMEAVEADRKNRKANIPKFHLKFMKYGKLLEEHTRFISSYEKYIKDTIEDELSDSCIRLLDLAGLRNIDLDSFDYEISDTEDYSELSFTESIFRICIYITDSHYKDELPILLNEIFAFCKDRGVDIFWHIDQKMKYNELRPYKHGNKNY